MDEAHLAHAIRYVSLNPVRARMVARSQNHAWSSVRAHLAGKDDALVTVAPVIERYGNFAAFLGEPADEADWHAVRRAETTGRSVGDRDWLAAIEARTGRTLAPHKRGPKPRAPTPAT